MNRVVVWAIWSTLTASVAYAQYIGLGINGVCEAGNCPAQPLPIGATITLPVSTKLVLANGDNYTVTGTITTGNPSASPPTISQALQIIYAGNTLGNGKTQASQADKITMDLYVAFQTSASTADLQAVAYGAFGPSSVSGTSFQLCVSSACSGTAIPPDSFLVTTPFSLAASGAAFYWDTTLTLSFGATSPVGSYILLSSTPAQTPLIRQSRGVITAGSYGAFSYVAPGAWIEIYGNNLAVGPRVWGLIDFNGSNAPTNLGGTSVNIAGQAAFVEYVSPTQVNVQVPSNVTPGPQSIFVNTASGSSAAYPITVAATAPGLLAPASFLMGGVTQYVLAVNATQSNYVLPPGSVAGLPTNHAKPGDVIILYGSGFGPVQPNLPAGQIAGINSALATNLNIMFGNASANIVYAGLSPGSVGLYQFNVVVPTVPASDKIPLTFSLGATAGTQNLYIAVGN